MDPSANIILAGFMGTGKSTVGRILADRLVRPLVDMDTVIEERAGRKISAIFAEDGEVRFRAMERDLVRELAGRVGLVVAAGGGAIVDPSNVREFERSGLLVCLTARPEMVLARVRDETHRPLLESGDKSRRIVELLEKRRGVYESIGFRVDTSDLSPEAAADAILTEFRSRTAS